MRRVAVARVESLARPANHTCNLLVTLQIHFTCASALIQPKETTVNSIARPFFNRIPYARLCLLTLLSLSVTGCISIDGAHVSRDDWKEVQRDNREMIARLEIGDSRSAVISRLGTPSDSEAFVHDGEEMRVLFYRTRHKHSDGETSRDESTPLVFQNDSLIGWGDETYRNIRH
jgi:hypothetical protein